MRSPYLGRSVKSATFVALLFAVVNFGYVRCGGTYISLAIIISLLASLQPFARQCCGQLHGIVAICTLTMFRQDAPFAARVYLLAQQCGDCLVNQKIWPNSATLLKMLCHHHLNIASTSSYCIPLRLHVCAHAYVFSFIFLVCHFVIISFVPSSVPYANITKAQLFLRDLQFFCPFVPAERSAEQR